jgi:hypothetical protein
MGPFRHVVRLQSGAATAVSKAGHDETVGASATVAAVVMTPSGSCERQYLRPVLLAWQRSMNKESPFKGTIESAGWPSHSEPRSRRVCIRQ